MHLSATDPRGYIAEIIGFARVLKADEESQVQKYLDEKYQKPKLTNPPADYLSVNEALETASEVFRDNPANVLLGSVASLLVIIVIVMSAQKNPNPDRSMVVRVFLALAAGCIAPVIPYVTSLNLSGVPQFTLKAGGAIAVFLIVLLLPRPKAAESSKPASLAPPNPQSVSPQHGSRPPASPN